jgi:hypothetical protein
MAQFDTTQLSNEYRQMAHEAIIALEPLVDPMNRAKAMLPTGPDNDIPCMGLTVETVKSTKGATSGSGMFLMYPGLPFGKRVEHYTSDGTNMLFAEFIEAAVDISTDFTYGRVLTSDIRFQTGFQLATGGTVSAGIQGFL